jgi:hypothetical protein
MHNIQRHNKYMQAPLRTQWLTASKWVVCVCDQFNKYSTLGEDSEMRMHFGAAPAFDGLHINTSTGLSYHRDSLFLKRVHQLIECLGELLDAFVFELLGHRVQINPYFA